MKYCNMSLNEMFRGIIDGDLCLRYPMTNVTDRIMGGVNHLLSNLIRINTMGGGITKEMLGKKLESKDGMTIISVPFNLNHLAFEGVPLELAEIYYPSEPYRKLMAGFPTSYRAVDLEAASRESGVDFIKPFEDIARSVLQIV